MADISFEEKVDYIYKELKSQKRSRYFNFAFKLSIIILLIFLAINITKGLNNKIIISKISSGLGTIVKPIVNDLIKENSGTGTKKESKNPIIPK